MAFTYILECRDGTYYCGWTNDLWQRIARHNSGKGARYTGSRRPVHLVYVERWFSKTAAMSREWHIKHMTRKEKSQLIESNQAVLVALGEKTDPPEISGMEIVPGFPVPVYLERLCAPISDAGIIWFCKTAEGGELGIAGGMCEAGHAVLYREGETVSYLAPSWKEFLKMPETVLENRWILTNPGRKERSRKVDTPE